MWRFTEDDLGPLATFLPGIFGSSGPEVFVLVNISSGHHQNKMFQGHFLESKGTHHLILKIKREVTAETPLASDSC